VHTFETISDLSTLPVALEEWKVDVCQWLRTNGRSSSEFIHPRKTRSHSGHLMPRPSIHLPHSLTRLQVAYQALFGGSKVDILTMFRNNVFEPYVFHALFDVHVIFLLYL
jgi:hypothetical protein